MIAIRLSTNRDFLGSDDKMIRIDPHLDSHSPKRFVRFPSQEIANLLAGQAVRVLKRLYRAVSFAEDRLDVLAMNLDRAHGA